MNKYNKIKQIYDQNSKAPSPRIITKANAYSLSRGQSRNEVGGTANPCDNRTNFGLQPIECPR